MAALSGPGSGPVRGRMGRAELKPMWLALAERWSRSGNQPVTRLRLDQLDEACREAIADLLGLARLPAATGSIAVAQLTAALGVDAHQLRVEVEELVGPISDRAGARRAAEQQRAALWAWLEAACRAADRMAWFGLVRRAGVPGGDVVRHRALLGTVLEVLGRLPTADAVPLARLAADVTGDPHGLDPATRAARLVLEAVALDHEQPGPGSAEEARRLWSQVGVVADELSAVALVYGLEPTADNPLAELLLAARRGHEPVAITMAQTRRWPLRLARPATVGVVENPSVLSQAAARRYERPLVCMSGWANVAVLAVLRQLAGSGAQLAVHADFDRNGLRITEQMTQRLGAVPWLMTSEVYLRHVHEATVDLPPSGPLPATPWDPPLAAAMARHGRAVYEEHLLDELLA